LIVSRMAEMSHSEIRNFFSPEMFKLLEEFGEGPESVVVLGIQGKEVSMRYLKYVALLATLMVPLAYSQAQVRVGVGVGFGPGYVGGPPVCAYGYYNYYPYACAPYGYYGPDWFANGVFVGAGPWYHGYRGYYYSRPGYWRRGWVGRGWVGRPAWNYRHGYHGHGYGYGYGHPYSRGFRR